MSVAVVFYSDYCPHSKKFIDLLENSGKMNSISRFICVDKIKNKGKRPEEVKKYSITEVPTVLTSKSKLGGLEAFRWVEHESGSVIPMKDLNREGLKSGGLKSGGLKSGGLKSEREKDKGNVINGVGALDSNSVAGINQDNSIFGEKPFPSEDSVVEKTDNFVLGDQVLDPTGKVSEDSATSSGKSDSLKQKQMDNAYNKLLAERSSS